MKPGLFRPYIMRGDVWWANIIYGLVTIFDGLVILLSFGFVGTSWSMNWTIYRIRRRVAEKRARQAMEDA